MFNWLLGENASYAIALIMISLEPDESPCHISPSELNPALLNFSPSLMNLSSYDIKHVFMEIKSISLRRQKVNSSCWILSLFFRDYFITSEKASIAVCTLQLRTRHFNHFNKAEATATKNYFINFLDLWLYNIKRCLTAN